MFICHLGYGLGFKCVQKLQKSYFLTYLWWCRWLGFHFYCLDNWKMIFKTKTPTYFPQTVLSTLANPHQTMSSMYFKSRGSNLRQISQHLDKENYDFLDATNVEYFRWIDPLKAHKQDLNNKMTFMFKMPGFATDMVYDVNISCKSALVCILYIWQSCFDHHTTAHR